MLKEEFNRLTDYSLIQYYPTKDLYDLLLDSSEQYHSSTRLDAPSLLEDRGEIDNTEAQAEKLSVASQSPAKILYSCNCAKSKCVKNYCECYRSGAQCSPHCSCVNCRNVAYKQSEHQKGTGGCNCRKSRCIKKYCQCHSNGRKCGSGCHCFDCQNYKEQEITSKSDQLEKYDVCQ